LFDRMKVCPDGISLSVLQPFLHKNSPLITGAAKNYKTTGTADKYAVSPVGLSSARERWKLDDGMVSFLEFLSGMKGVFDAAENVYGYAAVGLITGLLPSLLFLLLVCYGKSAGQNG